VRPPDGLALSAIRIAVRLSCAAQILSTLAPPAQQHMRVGVLVLSLRDTRTQPPPTLLVPLDAGLASHVLPASRSPPSQIQRSSRHVLPPSQIHGARPVGACAESGEMRPVGFGSRSQGRRGVGRSPAWCSQTGLASEVALTTFSGSTPALVLSPTPSTRVTPTSGIRRARRT